MKISKKKIVCALTVLLAVFFAACSDDSGSGTGTGFTSEEDDPSSYIAEKIVPIKNKTISGYAQKGPFRAGSIVTIYELELDGETFAQTGKSFTGKVANDNGEFKIPNVSLKSQYALLQVTGYFTSEINGEGVRATLTAVTDLSKRENVNVNILTHLEYDRVLALLDKGMNFTSAKKQAGREVLAAFGIGLEENSVAEDLNVSGESAADTALVAISKLVLAGGKSGTNRDEEDLSGLLANIAGSIGDGGGIFTLDHDRLWSIIRAIQNLKGWNGRDCSLPYKSNNKEEKYFYRFLVSAYVGKYCIPSLDGERGYAYIRDTIDRSTTARVERRYFCKDGEWRYMGWFLSGLRDQYSDIWKSAYSNWCTNVVEEECSSFGEGKDGDIRMGNMTGVNYKYDEIGGEWQETNALDTSLPFACTEKQNGKFTRNNEALYYCGHKKSVMNCDSKAVECKGTAYWYKANILDSLLFVCGNTSYFSENSLCWDSIIENKKMLFGCMYENIPIWTSFAVFDNDEVDPVGLAFSLKPKLNSLGFWIREAATYKRYPESCLVDRDCYLHAPFVNSSSLLSCSALRDSLQLKQNSP